MGGTSHAQRLMHAYVNDEPRAKQDKTATSEHRMSWGCSFSVLLLAICTDVSA